jgi:hypothetical protein
LSKEARRWPLLLPLLLSLSLCNKTNARSLL